MKRLCTALLCLALQLAATSASHASNVAGRVMFVSGPNSVEREGPTVGLVKGSYVFEGDTIKIEYKGGKDELSFEKVTPRRRRSSSSSSEEKDKAVESKS